MCTAITYKTEDLYFGRTLDYEFSYGEEITITPRNYKFNFKNGKELRNHYAMIGMAHVYDEYPLYYEAVNEKGLCIAGLNFVGNAFYHDKVDDKENIAQFEFIPWILSTCSSVEDAKKIVKKTNITGETFSQKFPAAQLHWIISDKDSSIVVESLKEEIKIYDNPTGVLTNNPPFDKQLFALNNYRNLSVKNKDNTFSENINLDSYSRGMGAIGLPGDLSSQSRFIRATFVKSNSISLKGEEESVNQFFHIINSVEQVRGCCELDDNKYEITIYSSCCNAQKGIYYYTTYNNHQINAVDMNKVELDSENLVRYPVIDKESINYIN